MALLGLNIALYTVLFFVLAGIFPKNRDIFINLATDNIAIGIAVFFVDVIIRRNKAAEWERAEKVAREDVKSLSNELVTAITVSLLFSQLKEWLDKMSEMIGSKEGYQLSKMIDWNLQKVDEVGVEELLRLMSDDGWRGLRRSIRKLEQNLRDCLALYGGVLPPKISGELLEINGQFKGTLSIFGQSLDAFVLSLDNPAGDKKFQNQYKDATIKNFAKDIETHFQKIQRLRKILRELGWNI